MARAARWIRLLLRDLWIHFFAGTLCLLVRHHRDNVPIGELVGRKGFRGVPAFQCRKCFTITLRDSDVKKLGGKVPT
jgi:hypothetical protein